MLYCYLPCSSGNSPESSDNLDQSVENMNPHLTGAQGKISRPSQDEHKSEGIKSSLRWCRFYLTQLLFFKPCEEKEKRNNTHNGEERRKESGLEFLLKAHTLLSLSPLSHIRSRPNFGTKLFYDVMQQPVLSFSEPHTGATSDHFQDATKTLAITEARVQKYMDGCTCYKPKLILCSGTNVKPKKR